MEKKLHKRLDKETVTTVLYPVMFGVLVIILWQTQVLHKIIGADTFTLPLPGRIVGIIRDNIGTILVNVRATVTVAVGGLIIGSFLVIYWQLLQRHFRNGCRGADDSFCL